MRVITRARMLELARVEGPCASIYLSLNPLSRESISDGLRLRKLSELAGQQLHARDFSPAEVDQVLGPLESLSKSAVWESRSVSMGIFLGPNVMEFLSFDSPLESEAWGDSYFHVRPLLPLVVDSERFFLLRLSDNHAKLWEGDGQSIRPLDVAGLPENVEAAVMVEDVDRGLQTHSANAGGLGKRGAMFHGHGGKSDAVKDFRRDYFQRVAEVIDQYLSSNTEPLVVAAVSEHMPMWREASQYPNRTEEFIAGNPDRLPSAKLHEQAWAIVRGQLRRSEEPSWQRLNNARGSARFSAGISDVLWKAAAGAIDTLFVDCRRPVYGRFDPVSNRIDFLDQPGDRADDLVELAIRETIGHRGNVYERRNLSGGETVEALLRF